MYKLDLQKLFENVGPILKNVNYIEAIKNYQYNCINTVHSSFNNSIGIGCLLCLNKINLLVNILIRFFSLSFCLYTILSSVWLNIFIRFL